MTVMANDSTTLAATMSGCPKTLGNADWPDAVANIVTLTTPCKGAALAATGTDGVLRVHPVDNAADKWYDLELRAGESNGLVIFDKVDVSTYDNKVDVSLVTLFPDNRIGLIR